MTPQQFLDTVRMNGGATYNTDTCEFVEPRFGFAIGMAGKRCLSREEIEPETVHLKAHAIAAKGSTDHVGLWIDEDGDLWIEATVVVQASLKDALALGTALKQRCIWSFATKRSIYLRQEAA